jgi:glycosyltransferase involved in cell wall biosynthesis
MRVALVASSYAPNPGGLERHVEQLALGLAGRGAQVEVLTQEAARRPSRVVRRAGVVVRRFRATGGTRFTAAPGLWEYLRRHVGSWDVVHVHSAHTRLGLAVARTGPAHLVFTPHAPIQRLVRWPDARVTQAVFDRADRIVCTSGAEADLLGRSFSRSAPRIGVVPDGVEVAAIQAAKPIASAGKIVLAVGRLERYKRMDRAIAAMASLDPGFRLVIVGDGPDRRRLEAYAADLMVASRVHFTGRISDPWLYRWLRAARVLVALAEQQASGLQLLEALSAGAPAVVSDIPAHREAASYAAGAGVTLVSPEGSPLEVGQAIDEAIGARVQSSVASGFPSWGTAVDETFAIYRALMPARRFARGSNGQGPREATVPSGGNRPDLAIEG